MYGIRRFIVDIERERDFLEKGETVIGSCLDVISNGLFAEFFDRLIDGNTYKSAHEFRNRHIINALKGLF